MRGRITDMGPKLISSCLGIDGISEKRSKPARVCTALGLDHFKIDPVKMELYSPEYFLKLIRTCENKPEMFVQEISSRF